MSGLPEKVLVAADGSQDAALAARAAVDVSDELGPEFHVVHAWQAVPTARLKAFARAEFKRIGEERLDEGVKEVEKAGPSVAGAHLVEGRAADAILDLAREIGAGLIVIGSRGLGPVGRIALGSVSEAVVHHAHCPVLVLRGGEGSWPPERVVFGDDGSEASRAAGDLAAALCGRHGARGLVVRAFPRLPEVDVEGRESDARMVEDELRHEEGALMEREGELEGLLGSRPKTRLAVGDAAEKVLEAADAEAAERTLVAVGSRGLGAIGRMRLGSVSTKVLHAARGPVLVHPHR
jgi:nucleotide-binding universal stress UspA family protein